MLETIQLKTFKGPASQFQHHNMPRVVQHFSAFVSHTLSWHVKQNA